MNTCILTNGILPVPAVNGGAVENLVQSILDRNEEHGLMTITVVSVFTGSAAEAAGKYRRSRFVFVKTPALSRLLDKMFFFIANYALKKHNAFNFRYIFRRLHFIYRCYQYLLKNDFDKIILENHHSLFLIMKSGKLHRKIQHKLYYHAHNQPYHDVGCMNEIRNCKHYITVSEYIRQTYTERYKDIPSNFFVLKNAVDTGLFGREFSSEMFMAERNRYGLAADDIVVLFTGRISEEKGIVELTKAFLHIDNPAIKLMIVGSSFFDTDIKTPLQQQLECLLRPCMERVIFTGYVNYAEIWKLYKIADIGCFPSLVTEAAPLTGIEAMATGLPFITTNSGGIPEYAAPDCAVILERDARLTENLRNTILRMAADPSLRQKMSVVGKEHGAVYNLGAYYQNFIDIISC
jgi:glycosyltransferase involved in cell wall biosynthesis